VVSSAKEFLVERTKAIFLLAGLLLVTIAVLAFALLPKHYSVGQSMPQAWAFWSRNDGFVLLMLNTTGRSRNVLQEKVAATRYGYLTAMFGGYLDFARQEVVAYHMTSNGQLDRFALPEHTTLSGTWSLENGRLQLAPPPNMGRTVQGFRWDGTKFVSVAPVVAAPHAGGHSTLTADDAEEEGGDYGMMNDSARKQLKSAGWHYKLLNAYRPDGGTEATLPMEVGGNKFDLTLENSPVDRNNFADFDFLLYGAKSLKISGDKVAYGEQVLWNREGWQTVSKADYERMKREYGGPRESFRFAWIWLVMALALLAWKFGSWFHLLSTFGSAKGRVLKNMPTSFSFPPATPAQFPLLDLGALERYTRELEGMGFTRLLDFSLISDSPVYPPSFCRLLAHTRHHCFALVHQFFPRGKAPLSLRCSLESLLQGGWSVAFSDRKPQAASSLLRRRRAIGVSMPEANTSELLQAFLKMRDQMCVDLGISPLNDDSLEAYISKTQRTANELREAVQEKNFVKGLSEVYLRKLSLLRTKPEYVWLGDYPKEAEQRKQGIGSFSTGVR
jgi:hypothetical protein